MVTGPCNFHTQKPLPKTILSSHSFLSLYLLLATLGPCDEQRGSCATAGPNLGSFIVLVHTYRELWWIDSLLNLLDNDKHDRTCEHNYSAD